MDGLQLASPNLTKLSYSGFKLVDDAILEKLVFLIVITLSQFSKAALALPNAVELAHFEKPSFRVKKKIFATLNIKEEKACIKLNEIDQSVFCTSPAIYPVPNKWGKQGWTFIELKVVNKSLCLDALYTAYKTVSGK
jgi:predicted DNA-binding protein (MmcQ/YjbR family)